MAGLHNGYLLSAHNLKIDILERKKFSETFELISHHTRLIFKMNGMQQFLLL